MRFWDTSAIVPLIVQEPDTVRRERQLCEDSAIAAWWSTRVECASALNRLAREKGMGERDIRTMLADLEALAGDWVEVSPSDRLRQRALRLLRVHPLRAADALRLSACLDLCDHDRAGMIFVCADGRLCEAAEKEGLDVLR